MAVVFKEVGKSKDFLKFQKTKKSQSGSLKFLLHKKLAHYELARDHSRVHASDITKPDFCAREFCLCDKHSKKPKGQYINTSLQATFDLGRSLQDMLNQDWGVDWCIGTWECRFCGNKHSFQLKPDTCSHCDGQVFKYLEEVFIHPIYGYSGSVDFIFMVEGGKYILIEVKTIVKDDFKKLVAPLAEHKLRTTLYLNLAKLDQSVGRKDKINIEEARILYICKGFGCKDDGLKLMGLNEGFSPFKEYVIKADEKLIEPIIERGKQVAVWRDKKMDAVMPSKICATSYCQRATKCTVLKQCWGE